MSFGTTLQYQGYTLKSTVEFRWARYFLTEGFDWAYEPMRFRDGKESYTPDFELDGQIFTEIKTYGTRNIRNHLHLCTKPLILIFGTPERHYCHLKLPNEKLSYVKTFAIAYTLARKALA